MTTCVSSSDAGIVHRLLADTDCHSQLITRVGFGALADPGSGILAILTGLLSLYVAIQGWRLMAGESPSLSAWTVALVKVGLILTLVTQWPVYETLVVNVLYRAPDEVADVVIAAYRAELGSDVDPEAVLQRAYDVVSRTTPDQASPPGERPAQGRWTWLPNLLLASTVGVISAARLVLAGLLAAGPLFITLGLLDQTRPLTWAWLRGSVACAVLVLLSRLALAPEAAMLRPLVRQLADLTAAPAAVTPAMASSALIVLTFSVIAALNVVVAALSATALRAPHLNRPASVRVSGRVLDPVVPSPTQTAPRIHQISRAAASRASLERDARWPVEAATAPGRSIRVLSAPAAGRLATIGQANFSVRRSSGPRTATAEKRRKS